MLVSAIGTYANSLPECLMLAGQSAEVTHNHPEGIKGEQATAAYYGYIPEYILKECMHRPSNDMKVIINLTPR